MISFVIDVFVLRKLRCSSSAASWDGGYLAPQPKTATAIASINRHCFISAAAGTACSRRNSKRRLPVTIGLRSSRLIKFVRQQSKIATAKLAIFLVLSVAINKHEVTSLIMHVAEVLSVITRNERIGFSETGPHVPFMVGVWDQSFQRRLRTIVGLRLIPQIVRKRRGLL